VQVQTTVHSQKTGFLGGKIGRKGEKEHEKNEDPGVGFTDHAIWILPGKEIRPSPHVETLGVSDTKKTSERRKA